MCSFGTAHASWVSFGKERRWTLDSVYSFLFVWPFLSQLHTCWSNKMHTLHETRHVMSPSLLCLWVSLDAVDCFCGRCRRHRLHRQIEQYRTMATMIIPFIKIELQSSERDLDPYIKRNYWTLDGLKRGFSNTFAVLSIFGKSFL